MGETRENSYAFAVARVRGMEAGLLDEAFLEQLLSAKDADACAQLLRERGWGDHAGSDSSGEQDFELMLAAEKEKTAAEVEELLSDVSALDVLNYPDLYHNLKAAVKDALTQESFEAAYISGTEPTGRQMREIVLAQDYEMLPGELPAAAKEAYETLLHTRDGQLCDIIVDRAALEAIYDAAISSDEPVIRDYGITLVDVANIRIAVRAQRTGKSIDFFRQAMVRTESIDPEEAGRAAMTGEEALFDYLKKTPYAEAAEALEKSSSAFECWCDDRVIESLKPQLYETFGMGPVIAWSVARDMEIKTVRIILTGKMNDLPADAIRERIRETYV